MNDGDLPTGLDGGLWVTAGRAASVGDRVYEVIAAIAHHEARLLKPTVVVEDGSQPAVADEQECVCRFVESSVAAFGCGGVNRCGDAPRFFDRSVRRSSFVPAVTGVLFDQWKIRLVEVGVYGHLSNGSGVVHRRLGASGCEAEYITR